MRCVAALQKRPDPEHQAPERETGETWCLFQPGLKIWSNLSGLMAGASTASCPGRERRRRRWEMAQARRGQELHPEAGTLWSAHLIARFNQWGPCSPSLVDGAVSFFL